MRGIKVCGQFWHAEIARWSLYSETSTGRMRALQENDFAILYRPAHSRETRGDPCCLWAVRQSLFERANAHGTFQNDAWMCRETAMRHVRPNVCPSNIFIWNSTPAYTDEVFCFLFCSGIRISIWWKFIWWRIFLDQRCVQSAVMCRRIGELGTYTHDHTGRASEIAKNAMFAVEVSVRRDYSRCVSLESKVSILNSGCIWIFFVFFN